MKVQTLSTLLLLAAGVSGQAEPGQIAKREEKIAPPVATSTPPEGFGFSFPKRQAAESSRSTVHLAARATPPSFAQDKREENSFPKRQETQAIADFAAATPAGPGKQVAKRFGDDSAMLLTTRQANCGNADVDCVSVGEAGNGLEQFTDGANSPGPGCCLLPIRCGNGDGGERCVRVAGGAAAGKKKKNNNKAAATKAAEAKAVRQRDLEVEPRDNAFDGGAKANKLSALKPFADF